MTNQDDQQKEENNVVPLSSAKKIASEAPEDDDDPDPNDLGDIAIKNKRNADRLKKERASANKSVLRSYRIKH